MLFIDFPLDVITEILSNLYFFSVLKLRKVCPNLRYFIDEKPPKFNCFTVEVCKFGNGVSIIMKSSIDGNNIWNEPTEIVFCPDDNNGCIIKWGNDEKEVVEMGNYVDVFLREFGLIMRHHSTEVLDSFSIQQFQGEHGQQVLEVLTRIVHVSTKEVVFVECTVDQIANFLPFFNSNDLCTIRIKDHFEPKKEEESEEEEDQENEFRMLNLQEIRQLEQWENTKYVEVLVDDFRVQIQDFLHFERVEIECGMLSVQDIVLLKESFLTSSTLTSFEILLDNFFNEREQLDASFGLPSLPVDQDIPEVNWFFRIPNSENILSFTFAMAYRYRFIFRRINIQDVPEGAVIKD